MKYIEEEVPSENESANSVKSMKVFNSNKLVIDKGNVRLSDVESFRSNQENFNALTFLHKSCHHEKRSDDVNKSLEDMPKISLIKPIPIIKRMSGTKNLNRKIEIMDSIDILANLWKKSQNKNEYCYEYVSDEISSISDVEDELDNEFIILTDY